MQPSLISHSSRRWARVASLALVLLFLVAVTFRPAAAACGSATVVTTEAQLNNAIADFNGQAGPCDYEIEFAGDITLTDDLTVISNANAGVSLLIDGAGFTLDGDDMFNSIVVEDTEESAVENLTVIDSLNDGIGGFGTDMRVSRVSVSGSGSDGVVFTDGDLLVVDSTLASNGNDGINAFDMGFLHVINTTTSGNDDDGIDFFNGFANLTHVTSVNNGIGVQNDLSDMTINNSILANNGSDCVLLNGAIDVNFSLVEVDDPAEPCGVTDGVDGNIVGVDPQLGILDNYGGPTQTHLPDNDSDAIDAGDNELADDENFDTLYTDQRGFALRKVNGTVDMGAVEVGAEELVCSTAMTVGDDAELIKAILCFNMATTPGTYEIVFEADITQTADLPTIQNPTAGVSLLIDGAGFTLDGDAQHDLINIQQSGVTIDRLTVSRADFDAIAATASNLRVGRSSIVNNASDGIDTDSSSLIVIDSTIANNGNDGLDLTATAGSHEIINSTISQNATRGVVAFSTTDVQLTQVTIYDNQTGVVNSDGQITVHNSILAGNQSDCQPGGGTGTIVFDHSLVEDAATTCIVTNGVDGNIVGVDPQLGALTNNGGPTETHLPDGDSDVIDAGDNDLADDENGDPLAADQRGFMPRVFNGTVDMGAVEVGAEEPSDEQEAVFMSTTTAGTTDDGLSYGPEDILQWDGSEWSLFFDGSAAGLTPNGKAKHNINAFYVEPPGTDFMLMSFAQNGRIVPGVGKVDGTDAVVWNGSYFILVFDGSDVGLTKSGEKIDGLHLLAGTDAPPELIAAAGGSCQVYLLISTTGPGKVPNYSGGTLSFSGEDVLGFCFTSNGDNTSGKWIKVLDGSDQGMPRNSTDSISLSADGETLYLTTRGTFNVDDTTGGHSMVYAYDMTTTEFSGPVFIAANAGLAGKVDGLQFD